MLCFQGGIPRFARNDTVGNSYRTDSKAWQGLHRHATRRAKRVLGLKMIFQGELDISRALGTGDFSEIAVAENTLADRSRRHSCIRRV